MAFKKSKTSKLLVVSGAMFASSIVAANPQQTEASSNVETLVKNAENLANALKWEVSFEHRKIAYPKNVLDYPNMKLFNDTKAAMFQAEKALSSAKGNQKEVLKARLDQNVKTHYDRAVRFIDAVTAGKRILAKSDALQEKLSKNIIDDSTEKAYHALTREIKDRSPVMYKAYGKSTRDAFINKFQVPAYKTKDLALYPVSIKIELDRLNKALADKDTDKTIYHADRLEMLFADGLNGKHLVEGSKIHKKLSEYYKVSYNDYTKLVHVLKAESSNINFPTVIGGTVQAVQKFDNTVVITAGKGQFIKLANAEVNGNIVVKGDQTGAGTVYLENVKVNYVNNYGGSIIVDDVAEHSLYMTKVSASHLRVNDSNGANIVVASGTIHSATVSESAGKSGGITLEAQQKGALGSLEIASIGSDESKGLTLKGDFSDSRVSVTGEGSQVNVATGAIIGEMDIRTQATIEAAKGALIKALNLAAQEKGQEIILKGDMSGTVVNVMNANAAIKVGENTEIKEVKKDASVVGDVQIENNGKIETSTGVTVGNNPPASTAPPVSGGGGGGGGSTVTPPTDENPEATIVKNATASTDDATENGKGKWTFVITPTTALVAGDEVVISSKESEFNISKLADSDISVSTTDTENIMSRITIQNSNIQGYHDLIILLNTSVDAGEAITVTIADDKITNPKAGIYKEAFVIATSKDVRAKYVQMTIAEDQTPPTNYTLENVETLLGTIPNDLTVYTEETVGALNTAKETAEALTEDSSQEDINAAYAALDAAIKGLVEKDVDPVTNYTLENVETLLGTIPNDLTVYTEETVGALNTAKETAEALTEDSSQEDINAAYAALDTAIKGLV
ncbi:hypothetical protein V7122_09015, partial [Bacillus sp. JJ1532]